jgi:peptidoglycan hydrolase-like protein with peptidoglycan-binding domain
MNGRMSRSELAPIAGGYLRKDAAAAWNAMNFLSHMKYGVTLLPSGSMSSYRTYSQQVYLWGLYQSGRGNLAATPGTSNHGLGLAVDCATPRMRQIVDVIGSPFGWAKRWSDAPSEWWHIRWRSGIWHGVRRTLVLRQHMSGSMVTVLQKLLRHKGLRCPTNGYFGIATALAVKRFQKKHGIQADGVVGTSTWTKLRS